jgi:2-polyprenyl-3-methyl-5-hydroxy-6-metoxy-1,4-benzoquinol methylase
VTTNPVSAAYFATAEPYLTRNHRIELRSEIVGELIGQPHGKRILDLGCGNGAVSLPFARSNSVILVDSSAAMLDAARRCAHELDVKQYALVQADACDVDVDPVDIVLALGVLAHVDSDTDIIRAIARNLKPGGLAVLQLSDANRPLNRVGNILFRLRGRRYRRTLRTEILQIVANEGLCLVKEQSHLLVLPGMPRLMGRALVPYDRLTRRYPRLAGHGLDTLMLLARQ